MVRPLALTLSVFFVSCSSQTSQIPIRDTVRGSDLALHDTIVHRDSILFKKSSSDTLLVDQRCAVFYIADSAQTAKRIKMGKMDTVGGDDYGDDNAYYLGQTAEFLDKHKVKILSVDDKKYILFKSQGNVSSVVRTDTLEELVAVFLFDPSKGFINADIVNIEGDFNKFLK